MKNINPFGAALILLIVTSAITLGQHQGHPLPAQQPVEVNPAVLAACQEAQRQTMALVDSAHGRLELARQTNEGAAMRSAIDDLQATLAAIRTQLTTCTAVGGGAESDPHAGHSTKKPQ